MSNEFVVLLAIVVAALGGGMSVACYFLAKQNEYLKEESNLLAQDFGKLVEELALAKEYQILCGDLEEKIEALEAWIASPPPAPTSKPAFAQDEDGIW